MEINPFAVSQTIQSAANNRLSRAGQAQQQQYAAEDRPMQQRLAQLKMDNAEQAAIDRPAQQQLLQLKTNTAEDERQKALAEERMKYGSSIYKQIQQNPEQAQQIYQSALQLQKANGVDVSMLPQQYDENAQLLLQNMNARISGEQASNVGTEEAGFNRLIEGLTPEQQEKARLIKLGMAPRMVNNALTSQMEAGTVDDFADATAQIEGAKVRAGLEQEFELKPAIAEAVRLSTLSAEELFKSRESAKSNAVALDSYNTAMAGLNDAMGDTWTGPVVGLMPALTTSQQKAKAASAAMAPILKGLFRSAGEGTFSDKDQELLNNMIPKRTDSAEARAFALSNMDKIVRAKLGEGGKSLEVADLQAQFQSPGQQTSNANKAPSNRKAPPKALQALKNDPSLLDQFKAHYGYTPEGY